MRKLLYYSLVCFVTFLYLPNMSIAQSSGMLFHYQFVPISDNFYDSGEYRKSIENSLKNENQTSHDSYRIAQCYAQLEMPDSAYFYLNKFIDENKVDCRVVLIDDDFELLRKNNTEWAKITEKIEGKFLESLAKTVNKEYALALFQLGTEYMRSSFTDISYKRTEESSPRQIWKVQTKVRKDFDKLVRKYGFPTQSLVGSDAVYTSIVVILSPDIKEKNYLMVQKAFKDGDYLAAHYAWITDRWLTQNGKLQLYGTLISWQQNADGNTPKMLMPVEDFANLNKRRAEIGLQTIEEEMKACGVKIPEEYYE